MSAVESIELPAASRLHGIYRSVNLADAYSVHVPGGVTSDPETLARFVFANPPSWVPKLMAVRDTAVAGFGLKTSRSIRSSSGVSSPTRVGIFRIYETSANEIVMGEDDTHLDFRVSVRYEPRNPTADHAPRIVISTVVHCHNLFGRTYIALIKPFHRLIVKAFLRRAARIGWPLRASV